MTAIVELTPDALEALSFQTGTPITLGARIASVTHHGDLYLAVLRPTDAELDAEMVDAVDLERRSA
jgi:hypothetical protein